MSTPQQIAANRRNAQLSTGPRTEAGKSRSRMNALQSGLHAESLVIRGEDAAALAQLSAEYHAHLRPSTPRERDLVDTVVHNQWLIRRLRLIEAQLWEYRFVSDAQIFDSPCQQSERVRRHPLAHAFEGIAPSLARLQSRLNSLERSAHRALAELRDLQQSVLLEPEPAPPETEPRASASGSLVPEIGFVPPVSPAFQSPTPNPPTPIPQAGFVPPALVR